MVGHILIVYDNRSKEEAFRPGWGFSALIEQGDKRLLFDVGADLLVFEHNAKAFGIDLEATSALALSHEHCDHIGAISAALHKDLDVYYPAGFSSQFQREIGQEPKKAPWRAHPVTDPVEILPGIRSTGQLGDRIVEQGLIVSGMDGPVLVVGCAHPGIVEMARATLDITGRPPQLVLGGFHLFKKRDAEVQAIAEELKQLGVKQVGPCHCTGDRAIATFAAVFGKSFLEVKAGTRIALRP